MTSTYVLAGLLGVGTAFIMLGCIGLLRLPDLFCRAHALTKAMTLGIMLVLVGAWMCLIDESVGFEIAVILIFQYMTIPVSGHFLGMVAFRKNIPRYKHKAPYIH